MTREDKAQIFLDAGFKPAYKIDKYDLRYKFWRVMIVMDGRVVLAEWNIKRKEFIRKNFEDELHRMPKNIQDAILFNMEMFDV